MITLRNGASIGLTAMAAALWLALFPTLLWAAPTLLDVQLRVETNPPAGSLLTTLPPDFYPVGAGTYYLDVWVRDVSGAPVGISGGFLDLTYEGSHVTFSALNHGAIYTTLAGGTINNPGGLIDDFGGVTFDSNKGDDEWALLGYLTFGWDGTRTVVASAAGDPQFARSGTGQNVDWGVVNLDTVVIPEPTTLVLLAIGSLVAVRRRLTRPACVR